MLSVLDPEPSVSVSMCRPGFGIDIEQPVVGQIADCVNNQMEAITVGIQTRRETPDEEDRNSDVWKLPLAGIMPDLKGWEAKENRADDILCSRSCLLFLCASFE